MLITLQYWSVIAQTVNRNTVILVYNSLTCYADYCQTPNVKIQYYVYTYSQVRYQRQERVNNTQKTSLSVWFKPDSIYTVHEDNKLVFLQRKVPLLRPFDIQGDPVICVSVPSAFFSPYKLDLLIYVTTIRHKDPFLSVRIMVMLVKLYFIYMVNVICETCS